MWRGKLIYNTELKKDTRFTDAKSVQGNQELLMDAIENGQIDIKSLNKMSKKALNQALLVIGFEKGEISRFLSLRL